MTEGDLLGAMGSAQEWYNDEPFAARPCSDIAYIASLIDDHQKTIEMATKAKRLYENRIAALN